MFVGSPFAVGAVVVIAASFGLAGCDRSGASGPSPSSAAAASSSKAPSALEAASAKTAACAVFNKAVENARVADSGFHHAAEDPKRPQGQWTRPVSDAADNAAVILAYVAKDVEANTAKPQLDPALAAQFKQFVQLARDRAALLGGHAGPDRLDPNAAQWEGVADKLAATCK
ncbi:MAG: hypothetical protein ACRC20_06735 [Segniliparus sp.]|uniref:hypothetical protein n=1 Tax=Segniliparus sp. TaxID=2804064 RepID=UPI003F3DE4A6